MDARIIFSNQSYDLGEAEVLLFQQDLLTAHEPPIVWRVIRRCGYDCTHPFLFATSVQLGIFDAWGNSLAQPTLSQPSDVEVSQDQLGRSVVRHHVSDHGGISVSNQRDEGVVSVFLARNGRAVTPWRVLAPNTTTCFQVGLELSVLAWTGLREGEALPPAALSGHHPFTSFDLRGLRQAELLMMGGGWGASASRLRFALHKPHYGPYLS